MFLIFQMGTLVKLAVLFDVLDSEKMQLLMRFLVVLI